MAAEFDRVVIGGGIFGCFAAVVLADNGFTVLLIEQDDELLNRASKVNQARLHTGLHYPRSIFTAQNAQCDYVKFRGRFGAAIKDFEQIYAISKFNSKTTGSEFRSFIDRLGIAVQEIDPDMWFKPGRVSDAFIVEEPTFDYNVLRHSLKQMILDHPKITIALNEKVVNGNQNESGLVLSLESLKSIQTNGLVIAAYASTNGLRTKLGLEPLKITFELTEVMLGEVGSNLIGRGFTVMDGPFWSMMPFGHSNLVSLTSVGLTPLRRSVGSASFDCQAERSDCSEIALKNCSTCPSCPSSNIVHHRQQMQHFLKFGDEFRESERLTTVKAILTSTETDDARPTVVHKDDGYNIWTIVSGKVSSIFDLENELK